MKKFKQLLALSTAAIMALSLAACGSSSTDSSSSAESSDSTAEASSNDICRTLDEIKAVSYTHLDVYKRQYKCFLKMTLLCLRSYLLYRTCSVI